MMEAIVATICENVLQVTLLMSISFSHTSKHYCNKHLS